MIAPADKHRDVHAHTAAFLAETVDLVYENQADQLHEVQIVSPGPSHAVPLFRGRHNQVCVANGSELRNI